MHVKLYTKEIERFDCPNNSDIDRHIYDIKSELVGEFDTYNLPEIGEIIRYNDKYYKVINKIRIMIDGLENNQVEKEFVCEVSEFTGKSYFSHGSRVWSETIPLVTQLERK